MRPSELAMARSKWAAGRERAHQLVKELTEARALLAKSGKYTNVLTILDGEIASLKEEQAKLSALIKAQPSQ